VSSLQIIDCVFRNNRAVYGSIARVGDSGVEVRGIVAEANSATYYGGFALQGGNLSIADSTFRNNTAKPPGPVEFTVGGSAITVIWGSLDVHNVTFQNNTGGDGGGAVLFFGSISSGAFQVRISKCWFDGNRGHTGGAIRYIANSGDVRYNMTIQDSTFTNNYASNTMGPGDNPSIGGAVALQCTSVVVFFFFFDSTLH
jgi:predicted outer membrane repeat protein